MNTKISNLLQRTITLEKEVDEAGKRLQKLVQRANRLSQEDLPTLERSQIIRDFVEGEKK